VDEGTKDVPSNDDNVDPNKQVVDPVEDQGQKDKSAPVTPDESADKSKSTEDGQPEGDKGKKKVDGAAEARKWGEQWKNSHDEIAKKFDDAKPLLDSIENDFGGANNLKLAAELYGGLADSANFDPESAVTFLSENFPEQAKALTHYIGSELIQRATDTALARTFGRNLSDGDVKAVKDFLAAGKPSSAKQMESFFKTDDIPEEMKLDSEGNPLPDHVIDYMRRTQSALRDVQSQTEDLKKGIDGARTEQQQQAAAEAVEEYVTANVEPIAKKIESLGLHQPIEGETPEIAEFRQECAELLEAYTLYLANKDKSFKSLYVKALNAVTTRTGNSKDRVAAATADDLQLRIQAMIGTYTGKAAKFISPLVESLAAKRGAQVQKVTEATPNLDAPASNRVNTPKQQNTNDDPFADVDDVIKDKVQRGEIRLR
jgi:ElaB/YqjD/DUF883 family membrane-anchored ribosome-binding protein